MFDLTDHTAKFPDDYRERFHFYRLQSTKKALDSGLDLSSLPNEGKLLSALRRFKTLFGMGRVGTTSLKRPE